MRKARDMAHKNDFDAEENTTSSSSSDSSSSSSSSDSDSECKRKCRSCGDGNNEPVARTPEELQTLFPEAFMRGDLDAVLSLYERNATVVVAPGTTVTGCDAIRQNYQRILNLFVGLPAFSFGDRIILRTKGVALVIVRYTLSGTGQNGQPIVINGTTVDVVRECGDGRWLISISNPFGTAALPPAAP